MTAKELRQCGIKIEKIDNGYRVPKTLRYTMNGKDTVIEIDKDDYFGIKSYVMTVNGVDLENKSGKLLRWESLLEAQKDVWTIFNGGVAFNYYTMA